MRRTTKLPPDWKQRLEKSIRNGESPFGPTQSEILDGTIRMELASSGIRRDMLRLLQQDAVEAATEYLWKHTEGRPTVQQKVPVYIHRALYWIAWALKDRVKEPLAAEYRGVIKILEQVRDDDRLFLNMGRKGEEFRGLLERAAGWYRLLESSAQRTKPKDTGQRLALSMLRGDFRAYFGSPMNQAVTLLMNAAFGGFGDVTITRARAADWMC